MNVVETNAFQSCEAFTLPRRAMGQPAECWCGIGFSGAESVSRGFLEAYTSGLPCGSTECWGERDGRRIAAVASLA